MQIRVQKMLKTLGFQPHEVFASNLIFVRSSDSKNLSDAKNLAKKCWPIHEFILDQIRPKGILTIGKEAFDFIYRKGPVSRRETFSSGKQNVPCYSAQVKLGKLNIKLVSVPHLGERIRYDILDYPDVIPSLKHRLGL